MLWPAQVLHGRAACPAVRLRYMPPALAAAGTVACTSPSEVAPVHSLVNVNVQLVVRDAAMLGGAASDLDGQPCAHLAPDEGHLGAQAKLAPCLLHAVLCT